MTDKKDDDYNQVIQLKERLLCISKKNKERLDSEIAEIENEIAGLYEDIEEAKVALDNKRIPCTAWHDQLSRNFSIFQYGRNKRVIKEDFTPYYRLCECEIQCADCHQYNVTFSYYVDKTHSSVVLVAPSVKKGRKCPSTGFYVCDACADMSDAENAIEGQKNASETTSKSGQKKVIKK